MTTTDASKVDDLLNTTVERLIPDALALNHGIRVTRTGPGEYTVETTVDVACGHTVFEHDLNDSYNPGVSEGTS
ncbi:hypothetical protein PUN71_015680 [Arthrobacter sp. NQ7]|uniref:hypothetical protein n=1 Tax=Arthrobacter sp. NQ7 TaxID=3032303 RepID=UPI002410730D|nr:hypothetical protein [Arthrobacter sp. NQ7]MDJ0458645.1 hypothetical protein [Arthrobacter sp. NQ7]